jgi:2-oxoglutarate ferredoxin oxidoreductase subunit alpha
MAKPLAATNDFVVKFANVNGSGSASANGLFAKVILRMGVPVGARNIFPSNIQGLPTWYEVRVSEAGWLGRRGGVDLMVAMNPQTWDADIKSVEPGGYLLYDSSKPLPTAKFRDDITVIGAPLTELIASEFADPRQRQLFKNICYVGVLAHLIALDVEVVEQLVGEEFKGKDKLIAPNLKAFELGRKYAEDHLAPIGLKVRKSDKVGDRIFVEGNDAAALGAVYGGATFCAWYPITPSTRSPKRSRSTAARCAPRPTARSATPSCRRRTRSRRSAWSWAPAGPVHALSPARRGPAFR